MNSSDTGALIVAIDLRKNRIRVHKETLHKLNDPKYIQFMFNPEQRVLLVRCCNEKEDQSMRISDYRLFQSTNSVEFYSLPLFERMSSVEPNIEKGKVYRLTGQLKASQKLAIFPLSTMKEIERD